MSIFGATRFFFQKSPKNFKPEQSLAEVAWIFSHEISIVKRRLRNHITKPIDGFDARDSQT
jgi:hypothetical protein